MGRMTLLALWGLGGLTGVLAAIAWFFSARMKAPNYQGLATFMDDGSGLAPADRYMRDLGRWNAGAAILTGISVLAGAVLGFTTLPLALAFIREATLCG